MPVTDFTAKPNLRLSFHCRRRCVASQTTLRTSLSAPRTASSPSPPTMKMRAITSSVSGACGTAPLPVSFTGIALTSTTSHSTLRRTFLYPCLTTPRYACGMSSAYMNLQRVAPALHRVMASALRPAVRLPLLAMWQKRRSPTNLCWQHRPQRAGGLQELGKRGDRSLLLLRFSCPQRLALQWLRTRLQSYFPRRTRSCRCERQRVHVVACMLSAREVRVALPSRRQSRVRLS